MGKNKTKVLGPDISYIDLLDAALKNKNEEEGQTRKYNPLRPSSAGKCGRALAHEFQEYMGLAPVTMENREANVIRLLSLGNSIEFSALSSLKELDAAYGITIKYKQQVLTVMKLDDGTLIEGSCDLCLEGAGYKGVADIKSMKDRFSKAFNTGFDELIDKFSRMNSLTRIGDLCFYADNAEDLVQELGDDFKVDNILQINLYALSDFMKERGYDHCSLLYYNKNDSRMLELRFRPSEVLKELVRQKFNAVKMAKAPEEVSQDFFLGSIRCSFCPYAKHCWSDNDPKKAFFKTLPKKAWPTDIGKIPQDREVIGDLFQEFVEMEAQTETKGKVEARLARLLFDQKISKIRLESGDIFELKLLKSPREHFEIRRTKL